MSFLFDRAVASPSGKYMVLVATFGTKAIILREGRVHRELNRSYYFAESYEYPLTVFALPDGRECVAHCPDEYCRLEIDALDTGERLTARQGGSPDFFHSRLQTTTDGRYLLSAGWIWHPLDVMKVFDLAKAVRDASELDREGEPFEWGGEVHSVAILDDRRALITTEPLDGEGAGITSLGIVDLDTGRVGSRVKLTGPVGAMMPFGADRVVAFYDHPRVLSLVTGECIREWPDISTGKQIGCMGAQSRSPAIAFDGDHRRFAVAASDHIAVVRLGS